MSTTIKNRYDFVYLFDVLDGNPNGDPDAGNMPRIDPETGHGLVTDVCLKRKVRNYIEIATANGSLCKDGNKIFIREKAILNNLIDEAHASIGKGSTPDKARAYMCENYYDVRAFGAVMATGKNAGQVRGSIQMTFARSISPIVATEHTITRVAVTTSDKEHAMGRKSTVPYALYRTHGFVSPHLASGSEATPGTGFSTEDLEVFWDALEQMFDLDRSAARGLMAARRLIIFKHDSTLGNAPAHKLLERVRVELRDPSTPARSFDDYEVVVDEAGLPKGIEILKPF